MRFDPHIPVYHINFLYFEEHCNISMHDRPICFLYRHIGLLLNVIWCARLLFSPVIRQGESFVPLYMDLIDLSFGIKWIIRLYLKNIFLIRQHQLGATKPRLESASPSSETAQQIDVLLVALCLWNSYLATWWRTSCKRVTGGPSCEAVKQLRSGSPDNRWSKMI